MNKSHTTSSKTTHSVECYRGFIFVPRIVLSNREPAHRDFQPFHKMFMVSTENFVLVTCATSGNGPELLTLFAKDGHNLIIVAPSEDELRDTSQELQHNYGVQVIQVARDLVEPRAAFELYEDVTSQGLQVDILVNNAGPAPFEEFLPAGIQRELDIVQVNVNSTIVLTRLFLKDMMDRNTGRILNVTSTAGKVQGTLQPVYHGTISFVNSFTNTLAEELKNTGVTVTSLLTGPPGEGFPGSASMANANTASEIVPVIIGNTAKDGYEAFMRGNFEVPDIPNKEKITRNKQNPVAET
jgi:short-subunit dehydrogenase